MTEVAEDEYLQSLPDNAGVMFLTQSQLESLRKPGMHPRSECLSVLEVLVYLKDDPRRTILLSDEELENTSYSVVFGEGQVAQEAGMAEKEAELLADACIRTLEHRRKLQIACDIAELCREADMSG